LVGPETLLVLRRINDAIGAALPAIVVGLIAVFAGI
jgi:hypothetical protein